MEPQELNLHTLCGGVLPELFQREVEEVVKNIADPNTDAQKPRRLTITIDFFPNKDRKKCEMDLGVTSKLLPVVKRSGTMYVGSKNGQPAAYTMDLDQTTIFEHDDRPKRPVMLKKEPEATA